MEDTITILKEKGILNLKNASAELHFDDVGLLQEIVVRQKRRRRGVETLTIHQKNGSVHAHYDNEGILQHLIYETLIYKRKRLPGQN